MRFGPPKGRGTGGQASDSTEVMRCYLLEQAGLAAVPFEAFGFNGRLDLLADAAWRSL